MSKRVVFLTFFPFFLCASEPSVFGAGDLNHPNPYGLTNEEKLILENKKEIQNVVKKHNAQNAKVETVAERLDGLQTIIEGLVETSNEQKIALQRLNEAAASDSNKTGTLEELKEQVKANTDAIAQFKGLLEELSVVVDGINSSYVTKEQFASLIQQLKINPASLEKNSAADKPQKMDNAVIEKEARKLFGDKKYEQAQVLFEQLVQKKYKTAEANFMIGETLFERKSYKEALGYYKASAAINDKALHMPSLLLHSGISLEKIGDSATAKAFYQTTVSKYGGSGAAKEAQERLAKLR